MSDGKSFPERLFETHHGVMLVGSDSPQLTVSRFQEAIAALEANPETHVIGPAKDGGFYLFLSCHPVSRGIWEQVNYSVETTRAELIELIETQGGAVYLLAEEQDVDEVEDLSTLREALLGTAITPKRRALLDWLKTV